MRFTILLSALLVAGAIAPHSASMEMSKGIIWLMLVLLIADLYELFK